MKAFNRKILFLLMIFVIAICVLFSCTGKVGIKKGIYYIMNPYTRSTRIINEKAEVLVEASNVNSGNRVDIIRDGNTKKPICIMKTIVGETKETYTYESEGKEETFDTFSTRVELYDLDGNKLPFNHQGVSYINCGYGDNVYYSIYTNDAKSQNFQYNVKTNEETLIDNIPNEKEPIDIQKEENEKFEREKREYEETFNKFKETIPDITYFQKKTHGDITYYMVETQKENNGEYSFENKLYDENFNLIGKDIGNAINVFEKPGLILVDYDTFYDFNLNKVKSFDRKSQWQCEEKWGKFYLTENFDTEYNVRDNFSVYDDKFNLVFSNLKNVNINMLNDYIVVNDATGTKLYDKNMKVARDYGRNLEIYGWNDNEKHYAFLDLDKNTQGIMDKNFNIIIDDLNEAQDLEEDHFTFQKGFKYGFMDYKGNVFVEFPVFDQTVDEEEMSTYELFTKESKGEASYPRVDGSTANMPMMAQIRSDYLGEDLKISEGKTDVTTTDYAWRNLIEGKNDLLLVYEPSAETKKIIEDSGVKLKITPIGVDALVFMENKNNPVDNITTSNLQDIYGGKITNWKELGGEDKKIEAFQRPLNSGSQTLFLNLLMKDKKPMEAPKEYRPEGMDDLIEVVASYKNTANAIGYSVYYYAKKMYTNDDLKLISVDGVMPTDETIASSEYPFLNEYYLVIREDTKEDSETMKLYNFILSDKGIETIKKAGYIPKQK